MKVPPLGQSPLVSERPVTAADPANDTILGAKAALKGAVTMRERARAMFGSAEREVERLRNLVRRLEDGGARTRHIHLRADE